VPRPGHTKDIASVRRQAAEGGLTFEAYLPPSLAEWVIGLVEQEIFHSPAEAVFVAMQSAAARLSESVRLLRLG
jgi:hypothetical protein